MCVCVCVWRGKCALGAYFRCTRTSGNCCAERRSDAIMPDNSVLSLRRDGANPEDVPKFGGTKGASSGTKGAMLVDASTYVMLDRVWGCVPGVVGRPLVSRNVLAGIAEPSGRKIAVASP